MQRSPTIALWVVNLAKPVNSLDAWFALVEDRMNEAAGAGVDLLVMPEYACVHWLTFRPPDLAATKEVQWMAEQTLVVLPRLKALVRETGVGLLPGTMPAVSDGSWRNRAFLLLPDGVKVRCVVQDKLCLTPFENDPAGWTLAPGREFKSFEWRGWHMGVLICLDVELPSLAARLAPLGLDVILVPSMTEREAGFHRVFGCARARAIELQTIVCVAGATGTLRLDGQTETNVSGAAVYMPCEESLGHSGILTSIGPMNEISDPRGVLLIARELPVDKVRSLRAGGAEVWPGCWTADHLRVS